MNRSPPQQQQIQTTPSSSSTNGTNGTNNTADNDKKRLCCNSFHLMYYPKTFWHNNLSAVFSPKHRFVHLHTYTACSRTPYPNRTNDNDDGQFYYVVCSTSIIYIHNGMEYTYKYIELGSWLATLPHLCPSFSHFESLHTQYHRSLCTLNIV